MLIAFKANKIKQTGKYKLALKDYEGIHKRRPNDKDAKLKYSECKKIVQQIAFQKAIAVEENRKSVADSIDLESMPVEEKYTGPRISESGIDLKFMKVGTCWTMAFIHLVEIVIHLYVSKLFINFHAMIKN